MTKTTFATIDDHAKAARTWYVVDASEHVLGRMAVKIAEVLMGKHTPLYTPHISVGAGVIVVNADKIVVSGNKLQGRVYRHYTGYIGGLKEKTMQEFLNRNPEKLVKLVVRRMLPKNRMGNSILSRLKVYAGPHHDHAAQKPIPLSLQSTLTRRL